MVPGIFFVLGGEEKSITQIAQEIGHSHASVSTIAKEMLKEGLLSECTAKADGRKSFIKLSERGLTVTRQIQPQYEHVIAAIERAFLETQYNLWKAIEEWELLLEQKSLLKRVQDEKKLRESREVKLWNTTPLFRLRLKNYFSRFNLNEEWITTWFKMEAADYKALDHPKEYILDNGGHILMALYQGEAVGTCALIKMNDDTFELAKMAVAAGAKGKGIGWLLGQAVLGKARKKGAKKLYLESNTILKPAINLYHKLGFKKITGTPSPYKRCNIQMELIL